MDFLVPGRAGSVTLVECKAARTVTPAMAAPMRRLAEAIGRTRKKPVPMFLVHESPRAGAPIHAVAPGVRALPWPKLLEEL